ncbi:hypothetical protein BC831DRAFT_513977 [Entophlyctis helioformis]|nr:hypothetical protein BC831DRAFT_513977 [Entophlyctis helioformis]
MLILLSLAIGVGVLTGITFRSLHGNTPLRVDVQLASTNAPNTNTSAAFASWWRLSTKERQELLDSTQASDEVRIDSFKFCRPLNKAAFQLTSNPDGLRDRIDSDAQHLFSNITGRYPHFRPHTDAALRFSCLMAAQGHNTIVDNPDAPLLRHIDPANYYSMLNVKEDAQSAEVLATLSSIATKKCSIKPHYKIVYAVFVHDDINTIKFQYSRLKHPDALIIYHVDQRRQELYLKMRAWLLGNKELKKDCNVLLLSNPFRVHWGHVSIVFSHLETFFQLQDIASWDYVINLSAYDYPLASLPVIHGSLEPDMSYMDYEPSIYREDRLAAVAFESTHSERPFGFWYTNRAYQMRDDFPPYQQSQWMILSHSFVSKLRSSLDFFNLLAWMEHTFIPDEMVFATWALAPGGGMADHVTNDAKRYLRFTGSNPNPDWLTMKDAHVFRPNHFMARKIKTLEQTDFVDWIDKRRARMEDEFFGRATVGVDANVTSQDAAAAAAAVQTYRKVDAKNSPTINMDLTDTMDTMDTAGKDKAVALGDKTNADQALAAKQKRWAVSGSIAV